MTESGEEKVTSLRPMKRSYEKVKEFSYKGLKSLFEIKILCTATSDVTADNNYNDQQSYTGEIDDKCDGLVGNIIEDGDVIDLHPDEDLDEFDIESSFSEGQLVDSPKNLKSLLKNKSSCSSLSFDDELIDNDECEENSSVLKEEACPESLCRERIPHHPTPVNLNASLSSDFSINNLSSLDLRHSISRRNSENHNSSNNACDDLGDTSHPENVTNLKSSPYECQRLRQESDGKPCIEGQHQVESNHNVCTTSRQISIAEENDAFGNFPQSQRLIRTVPFKVPQELAGKISPNSNQTSQQLSENSRFRIEPVCQSHESNDSTLKVPLLIIVKNTSTSVIVDTQKFHDELMDCIDDDDDDSDDDSVDEQAGTENSDNWMQFTLENENENVPIPLLCSQIQPANDAASECKDLPYCGFEHDKYKIKDLAEIEYQVVEKRYKNFKTLIKCYESVVVTQHPKIATYYSRIVFYFLLCHHQYDDILQLVRFLDANGILVKRKLVASLLYILCSPDHPNPTVNATLNLVVNMIVSGNVRLSYKFYYRFLRKISDEQLSHFIPQLLLMINKRKLFESVKRTYIVTPIVTDMMRYAITDANYLDAVVKLICDGKIINRHFEGQSIQLLKEFSVACIDAKYFRAAEILQFFLKSQLDASSEVNATLNCDKQAITCVNQQFCDKNCVLKNELFLKQSDNKKVEMIMIHVKNKRYTCILTLLEMMCIETRLIVDGCCQGLLKDPATVRSFELFLTLFNHGNRQNNMFFSDLSSAITCHLITQSKVTDIVAMLKIVITSSIKLKDALHFVNFCVHHSEEELAVKILDLHCYAEPPIDLNPVVFLQQQHEHISLLYQLLCNLCANKCFVVACKVLQNAIKIYAEKASLWKTLTLDVNKIFDLVIMGLTQQDDSKCHNCAVFLYEQYHNAFMTDSLLPIEISIVCQRRILISAVMVSQWNVAENLYNFGMMQGVYPIQSKDKPLNLVIYTHLTMQEIFMLMNDFIRRLLNNIYSELFVKTIGSAGNNISEFDRNLAFEVAFVMKIVPLHSAFEENATHFYQLCSNSLLDVKCRFIEVCEKWIQPPIKVIQINENLHVSGSTVLHYLKNRGMIKLNSNKSPIKLRTHKLESTPEPVKWPKL